MHSFDKIDEWHQAETLMTDYRAILERREELNSETELMNQHNEELEEELKSNLSESVNEELKFPPLPRLSRESCMKSKRQIVQGLRGSVTGRTNFE